MGAASAGMARAPEAVSGAAVSGADSAAELLSLQGT